MIERIVHLGFEVRVELTLPTAIRCGHRSRAPRPSSWSSRGPDRLRTAKRARVFEDDGTPATAELQVA